MNILLARVINILHILFVIFVVSTPFTSINYILLLHSVFLPFLILHWVMNDNTCVLTLVERQARKQALGDNYIEEDCITCKLIEPIYNFKNDYKTFNKLIYTVTIALWSVSIYKLASKYFNNEIHQWRDLFEFNF